MPEQLKKYKPEWNLEFYVVKDKATLELEEIEQSRDVFDMYSEIPDFAGIIFVIDNLNKIIWTWCSTYSKSSGWAKKIIKESSEKKSAQHVISALQDEMQVDFSEYKVSKVIEGEQNNEFEKLFLYDVVDINLYQKHYYKPEYEHLYEQEQQQEEQKSKTKKCLKCGWIMSTEKTICPRCQKNPDTEK